MQISQSVGISQIFVRSDDYKINILYGVKVLIGDLLDKRRRREICRRLDCHIFTQSRSVSHERILACRIRGLHILHISRIGHVPHHQIGARKTIADSRSTSDRRLPELHVRTRHDKVPIGANLDIVQPSRAVGTAVELESERKVVVRRSERRLQCIVRSRDQ